MAKRYSGLATVTVTYDDRRGDYKASVAIGKRNVWSGRIGEPKSRTVAVDSPSAYDDVAHAALSFAVDEEPDLAGAGIEYDRDGYGWHIARTKAKRSVRHVNPRGVPKDADSLYRIRREPLNAGGYTAGRYGQYFGRGAPLFAVETPDGDVLHVRGADRQDAMRNFREEYKYHHGGKHRTARFFGEKRAVANPARKRKAAAKRSWRVVIARDGRSLSVGSHVYEVVDATTRDGAMKAALRRHDSDARVVSLTELG